MTKVYQRLIDKNKGDCMQAAIASLFNISYEETPAFIEYKNGFFEPLFNLMTSQNLHWKGVLYNYVDKTDLLEEFSVSQLHNYNGVDGYFFASVYSRKYNDGETTHAVIIDKDYNIVHDPNPENINVEYPLAKELGYNGIISIFLIEKQEL